MLNWSVIYLEYANNQIVTLIVPSFIWLVLMIESVRDISKGVSAPFFFIYSKATPHYARQGKEGKARKGLIGKARRKASRVKPSETRRANFFPFDIFISIYIYPMRVRMRSIRYVCIDMSTLSYIFFYFLLALYLYVCMCISLYIFNKLLIIFLTLLKPTRIRSDGLYPIDIP